MKKKNSKLPIILISSLVLILVFLCSKFSFKKFNKFEFAVKISKIRLERLRLIEHEKDSVKLGEKSIRSLYETLWREEQELTNEDPPLISVYSHFLELVNALK